MNGSRSQRGPRIVHTQKQKQQKQQKTKLKRKNWHGPQHATIPAHLLLLALLLPASPARPPPLAGHAAALVWLPPGVQSTVKVKYCNYAKYIIYFELTAENGSKEAKKTGTEQKKQKNKKRSAEEEGTAALKMILKLPKWDKQWLGERGAGQGRRGQGVAQMPLEKQK